LISACNGSDSRTDSVSQATFDTQTAELNKTKADLAKVQQDNTALTSTVQSLSSEVVDLVAKRDQNNSDIAALISQIDDLNAKIKQNDQVIAGQSREIDDLEAQLADAPTEAEKADLKLRPARRLILCHSLFEDRRPLALQRRRRQTGRGADQTIGLCPDFEW